MPTGARALELALIGVTVSAFLIWRLGRRMRPRPGAAEAMWREGWRRAPLHPFGYPATAPIGQPEAIKKRPVSHSTTAMTWRMVLAFMFVGIDCGTILQMTRYAAGTANWFRFLSLGAGVTLLWVMVDLRLRRVQRRNRR